MINDTTNIEKKSFDFMKKTDGKRFLTTLGSGKNAETDILKLGLFCGAREKYIYIFSRRKEKENLFIHLFIHLSMYLKTKVRCLGWCLVWFGLVWFSFMAYQPL